MSQSNIMSSTRHGASTIGVPPEEWRVRVELAIAYRLLDWLNMTDLIHTHISVRVPDAEEQFLQLPYGHLFSEARASNMVKCDVDGEIVTDPTGLGISKGGFCIHSAIHVGRADAVCVMHAHTEATVAVSNYREGLLPLSQHALRFYGKISYLEYCGLFDTQAKRASLPQRLGHADVLMLRNHGPLVVGTSVKECFSRMYYLERACRMQVASLAQCRNAASELVTPRAEDCELMAKAFENGDAVVNREWEALVRMLRATNPGFDT